MEFRSTVSFLGLALDQKPLHSRQFTQVSRLEKLLEATTVSILNWTFCILGLFICFQFDKLLISAVEDHYYYYYYYCFKILKCIGLWSYYFYFLDFIIDIIIIYCNYHYLLYLGFKKLKLG